MSFTFSFSGDDIEADGEADSEEISRKLEHASVDETTVAGNLIPPQTHTLGELLESLPSQISYNYLPIASSTSSSARDQTVQGTSGDLKPALRIPRRSLFDIRQQLMAEADPAVNSNDNLLSGLEQGDLQSGIYEGGFKTWECALDLAAYVHEWWHGDQADNDGGPLHVIELGAGSAIPSLVLLQDVLKQRTKMALEQGSEAKRHWSEIKFTLCDYNEDVLRLGTAVNVFLVSLLSDAAAEGKANEGHDCEEEANDMDFEDIDEEMVKQCTTRLADFAVSVDFVSGAWGPDFLNLVRDGPARARMLVLASETIYSPTSNQIFSRLLVDLMQRNNSSEVTALVAAKKVYFGVGGGVQDFSNELIKVGGSLKTVFDKADVGVGRVILEINTS